jgi:hypothetical protein
VNGSELTCVRFDPTGFPGGVTVVVDDEEDDDPEHPATARVSASANHPSPKARPTFPQEPPTELIIPDFPAGEELIEIQAPILIIGGP